MKKECYHCHRSKELPGVAGEGTTHGLCARCYLLVETKQVAKDEGTSLGQLILDEPDTEANIIDAIVNELASGSPWNVEWAGIASPEEEALYQLLERKAKQRRIERESGGPDKR